MNKKTITQKRMRCKASFCFGEDEVEYYFKGRLGDMSGGSILYKDLPISWGCVTYKPGWYLKYLILGFLLFGASIAIMGEHLYSLNGLNVFLTFAVGALAVFCVERFWFYPVRITMMNPDVFIIHDEHYDEIMNELALRRVEQIKKRRLAIDFMVHPADEWSKYLWLKDKGIITEGEFNEYVEKLHTARSAAVPTGKFPD